MEPRYEVVVGSIGTVYRGRSRSIAFESFDGYKRRSKEGLGRASGESVTLIMDEDIVVEYVPEIERGGDSS